MTSIRISLFCLALSCWCGCAPGLAGEWRASGHTGVADAFEMKLTFQSEEAGRAKFATQDRGERAGPICDIRRAEQLVTFVVDTEANTTCTALSRPLGFRGTLGQDIIAGQIYDSRGEAIGIWRARRQVKD